MVTIKHKLKTYRFLFTINAWFICCDELKCELHELGEFKDIDLVFNLVYGAYINACLVGRYKIKANKNDIERLLRKIKKEDYDRLTEAMLSAKIQGRTVGELMKEQKEK